MPSSLSLPGVTCLLLLQRANTAIRHPIVGMSFAAQSSRTRILIARRVGGAIWPVRRTICNLKLTFPSSLCNTASLR